MLISSGMLKNSIEKYNNYKKLKETYKSSNDVDASGEGNTNGENTADEHSNNGEINMFNLVFMLVVSFMFFLFEFLLLLIAVMMAIKCTAPGKERFVHVVLALFYTAPYLLIMAVLNPDAKTYLRSSLNSSSDSKSSMWK